jgi:flagellar FliL protein
MAEKEEGKSIEGGEETEAKEKSSSKKFILIGLVLLLLGGGGFAGWRFFLAENPSQKDDEAIAAAEPSPSLVRIMYEMKPFIVNLFGEKGRRYLKARLELEFDNEAIGEELKERNSQLRDAILLLLGSKTFDDISSPNGKIQLRTELIARINQILEVGAVRTLYFTEFVVQ